MTEHWDSLRILLALTRGETPEAAARALHVDVSTVRRRLAGLEQEFGATLFERTNGIWRTTRAGTLLREAAEAMEQAVLLAQGRLDQDGPTLAGTVRIGAPEGIGSILLAPALASLQRRVPELRVELFTSDHPADISRREVDLMIITELPETGQHRLRKLRPVTLKLYAAQEYLASMPPIRGIGDLSGHRFVGYNSASHYAAPAVRRLTELGIFFDPHFICSSVAAQSQAMSAGAGLAFLPDYMIAPGMDAVPILPDEIAFSVELWLLIHVEMARHARVRAAADAILAIWPNRRDDPSDVRV